MLAGRLPWRLFPLDYRVLPDFRFWSCLAGARRRTGRPLKGISRRCLTWCAFFKPSRERGAYRATRAVAAAFLHQMHGSTTEVEAGDVDPEGLASIGEAMVIHKYLDRSVTEM